MPEIYDNIENHLFDGLKNTLKNAVNADFCVGYFNLKGWKHLSEAVDNLPGKQHIENNKSTVRYCRLIVGMQKLPQDLLIEHYALPEDFIPDNKEIDKIKKRLALEFKNQLTIGTPSEDDEKHLRILSRQLKEGRLKVKLYVRTSLHAKLYLAYRDDFNTPIIGFLGSSNLTMSGLKMQGELNVDVTEQDAAKKLQKWYEDRWNDRKSIDITVKLAEIIDESWAKEVQIPPHHIYLKMVYHLSQEARAGINEFKLPRVFAKELLEFQQKAVLVAAHHLHKRNGVMIGDVVGLGKTITACAVAKIMEEDLFLETLILSPKNLCDMWEGYLHKYQLRGKVISQSKVQKDLPSLRRYRLVVIDESHNLRNSNGSRYRAIKEYIEANESKVVLLSATPYNKSYIDLANQLKLFISPDRDLGISPEHYIKQLGGQIKFKANHGDTFIRGIGAFEKSDYADDWRELMRLFLIRRTRSFIKNNYSIDGDDGRKYLAFQNGMKQAFPDRIPLRVEFPLNENDLSDQYAQFYNDSVVAKINELDLPRYGLGNFINKNTSTIPTAAEKLIIENLGYAGKRLMGFCRTNLFKRLESSGYSFLLSLSRHVLRNYIFIYAIENNLPLPIGRNFSENLDDFIDDDDIDNGIDENQFKLNILITEDDYKSTAKEIYDKFSNAVYKDKFDWIRKDFFDNKILRLLKNDSKLILAIIKLGADWTPINDRKLNALYKLLNKKHKDEKAIVFTQFADTAYYITNELKSRGLTKIECVTGSNENPTRLAHLFSPISNNKPHSDNELRVLIATDVLSEGQNLQDSHIIINYDLPWAIIRLIQRAGRVDRIGQISNKILCYSFLPEDGIDKIINLRSRLRNRISQNAEVIGSDETFFDGDPINITDLYNEKAGILDESDDDAEVDLASYAYQIWLNAIKANPKLANIVPDISNVSYSTFGNIYEKEGVVVYIRSAEDNDILTYIDKDGSIITQSQYSILKIAQCGFDVLPSNKLANHHMLVKDAVDYASKNDISSQGSLGKKTGIRYKTYMRLDRYINENDGTFFITDQLKKAVDEIARFPIMEAAKDSINRQLKAGCSDEQLANLVISLSEENKLCLNESEDNFIKMPQIICSLGINNG